MTRGTVRSLSMKNVCSQFSYRVSAWSSIFVLSLCRSPTTSSIVRLYLRWSQADRIIRSLNGREKHEESFLSCYYDNVINFVMIVRKLSSLNCTKLVRLVDSKRCKRLKEDYVTHPMMHVLEESRTFSPPATIQSITNFEETICHETRPFVK